MKNKNFLDKSNLAIFEGKNIRRIWDGKGEKWWFSLIDVVFVLTGSSNARTYWRVLKNRLKKEGSQVVTKCNDLKLLAPDGKYYFTDCADTETVFRIIQSIPSPNAEPFKLWLARIGYERVEEVQDPELGQSRTRILYKLNMNYCHAEFISASLPCRQAGLANASRYLKQVERSRNKFGMTLWQYQYLYELYENEYVG